MTWDEPIFVEGNITRDTPAWPYQFCSLYFDPYKLRDWCIENLTGVWAIHDGWKRNISGQTIRGITIKNAEDAMAFKLTWM